MTNAKPWYILNGVRYDNEQKYEQAIRTSLLSHCRDILIRHKGGEPLTNENLQYILSALSDRTLLGDE